MKNQQLHLRRVGVEAKPELVKGFSGDGNAGSSMGENNGRDHFDNSGKDHEDPGAQEGGSDLTESFNSETHGLHQQVLAKLLLNVFYNLNFSMHVSCASLILQYYALSLYITSKQV